MSRRSRGGRGSASIELVAMVPILLVVALVVLQLGVAAWTAAEAQEAARQAARAKSLGESASSAAEDALPGALSVASIGVSGETVTLQVQVPRVSPLPVFTVTRDATMPEQP
ncbi:TadE/TadG family type IV pilus assembly protein [Nocardioides sp. Kera G14]|uniref:TadE/TadG family type IV pilus assembly protein n=1 Tax=Nocardioides sp. Kera G14 TaxID=2884264 RepID=UPI001D0FDBDF|nr:TadE/TadG family type IV pilus assembly protein [Nocardioides sp. Kera G14]UDY23762.1 pilus assembly protein [Nocardioides sp. Kera G14]